MSEFLLDTSVLSAFAPDRLPVPENLRHWIVVQGERRALFVSSITIVEIQRGISRLRRSGGTARANRLEDWLANLLVEFSREIIPVETEIARHAGRIEDAVIAIGRNPGLADVLIAATAQMNDLLVLTTNVRHFAVLSVPHLDPFSEDLPGD